MAYKHVIRAKTKNLLDYNKFNPIWKTNGIISDSGYLSKPASTFNTSLFYTVSGYSATLPDVSNLLQLKGTYTFSISSISIGDIYIMKYNADGTMNKQIGSLTNNKKIETLTFDELTYIDIKIQREIAVIVTGLMVQEGLTPTPYTPYNYLQSNKRMIKVSDVCQLLDKSRFPATLTEGGVTFTNNGDGTITANGTSTKNYAHYPIIVPRPAIGHKILVLPETNDNTRDHIYVWASSSDSDSGWVDDLGYGGSIITITGIGITRKNPYTRIGINLNVNKDWVMNNHIYKPQLFDLTEMFGAGHEPATVSEFRQRFPNELYPYSPQCWLTSYKSAVVCKTKNLFDVNNAVVINYNSQQETTDATHYVKDGIVYSDWNNHWTGTCVGIKGGWTLPAGTYTMSAKIAYNTKRNNEDNYRGGAVGFACILADGSKTYYTQWHDFITPGERYTYTAEIPEGCKNIMLYLGVSADPDIYSLPAAYCELMVEKGSTATSYVPYQYL